MKALLLVAAHWQTASVAVPPPAGPGGRATTAAIGSHCAPASGIANLNLPVALRLARFLAEDSELEGRGGGVTTGTTFLHTTKQSQNRDGDRHYATHE